MAFSFSSSLSSSMSITSVPAFWIGSNSIFPILGGAVLLIPANAGSLDFGGCCAGAFWGCDVAFGVCEVVFVGCDLAFVGSFGAVEGCGRALGDSVVAFGG